MLLSSAHRGARLTFGTIECSKEGGWAIDAKPFVMQRLRALFPKARGQRAGQHTHRGLILPETQTVAKDLLWLMDRYPMDMHPDVQSKVDKLAAQYDRAIAAATKGDSNQLWALGAGALEMAEPARPHQVGFRNLALDVRRLLLADDIGLGKTISAITLLCDETSRPAVIVVPTHLTRQWDKQVHRFLPGASRHIIKGRTPYALPEVDVYITAYTRLQGWEDVLVPMAPQTVIFDEVQDLRHVDTTKRAIARGLSEAADVCVGLSATPIYNYAGEIWSIIDVIHQGCLGPREDFLREWCTEERVNDPAALHSYLTSQGLMLRRTRKDLGQESEPVTRDVITLQGDIHSLKELQDVAKALAISVLSNRVGESDRDAIELDWKLRKATGIAKAKAVAEFVKMLAEQGEKVFLVGWHRDVYDIWLKELRALNPVMYTGTESPMQKAQAVERFIKHGSKVFICSLRSGAGLDGLQEVCSKVVFGELDWSPQVMDQVIGRLDREGQPGLVNAYFMTIDDGADPFMIEVLGDKASQSEGVLAGTNSKAEVLDGGVRSDRIREMAEAYLISIGEALPNPEPTVGLHAEVVAALRRLVLPSNTEREMQEAVWSVLPAMIPHAKVEREFRFGERGRLDFRVSSDTERIAIECKIDQTGRASVYRQVRRYAEEANITGVVILAPWSGVNSFVVDDVPVTIVDWAKQSLLRSAA